MDAVKFIEERNRMCGTMSEVWGVDAAQIVKNTEEWAAAHPRKTRKSVFLERYPNAQVVADTDIPCVYPCDIEQGMKDVNYCESLSCYDCRREFWMQEVQ
jgi:hypothetical protein